MYIRGLIDKNIGRTHTDLLRLFEKMNEELRNMHEERAAVNLNFDAQALEQVNNNRSLSR